MSLISEIITELVEQIDTELAFHQTGQPDGEMFHRFHAPKGGAEVGGITLHGGGEGHAIDRLVQIDFREPRSGFHNLVLWALAAADSPVPHLHAQCVAVPGGRFVWDVNLIPRVDCVMHRAYWQEALEPLAKVHARFTRNAELTSSRIFLAPKHDQYLSPYGLAGARCSEEELQTSREAMSAYVGHFIQLARSMRFDAVSAAQLEARDALLLEALSADDIDERAWAGVRQMVGEASTAVVKRAQQVRYDDLVATR